MQKISNFVLLFLLCGFILGCGNDMVTVKGKVTFDDGSPVTRGDVLFDDGTYSASGAIQSDGTYTLGALKEKGGVRPGDYNVTLQKNWEDPIDEKGDVADSFEVDMKFRTAETSGLKCKVESGKSIVYNFSVERKKK